MNKDRRAFFAADKISLVKNIVLIDGIGRTGKFFLGKIVSGFRKIEYFQYVSLIEHLPFIERLGCIAEDAAISLLKVNIDEHAYNMRIGRNLNLRYNDASSIYSSYELDEYLKRGLNEFSNEEVRELFHREDKIPLFVTHENLSNINIFFKAYPKIKIINLIRHPVDIVHSWFIRGWGDRHIFDPLSFIPLIKGEKHPVPWYANEWKEEYESLSDIDRIIKSIATLLDFEKKSYQSLNEDQRKQIVIVRYEDLVEHTNEAIGIMCSFLETEPSEYMPQILTREKCPKNLPTENQENKSEEILSIASKDNFSLLLKLARDYEKFKSNIE